MSDAPPERVANEDLEPATLSRSPSLNELDDNDRDFSPASSAASEIDRSLPRRVGFHEVAKSADEQKSDSGHSSHARSARSNSTTGTAAELAAFQQALIGSERDLDVGADRLAAYEASDSDTDDEDDDVLAKLDTYESLSDSDRSDLERVIGRLINTNRQLKGAMKFTRNIATGSTQAIVVIEAKQRTIVWVNTQLQVMFGLLAYQLLGQNVNILMPTETSRQHDKFVKRFVARWRDMKSAPVSHIVDNDVPREVDAVRYNAQGEKEVFQATLEVRSLRRRERTGMPPQFFVGYLADVSKQANLEKELVVARIVQDRSSVGIVVADSRGTITNMNPRAEEMFGVPLTFLLRHSCNVNWLCPRSMVEQHDSYMHNFQHNLKTGNSMRQSAVFGKSRNVMGRRPGPNGDVLFPIELRVELINTTLVAFIRDTSETITRTEFQSMLSERLFPKPIAQRLTNSSVDVQSLKEQLDLTVVLCDLQHFSEFSSMRAVSEVYSFVSALYQTIDEGLVRYNGELVKRTGDGAMAVFGLGDLSDRAALHATAFAVALQLWAHENKYQLRVGVASGPVGCGVFGSDGSRQSWDIWGSTVNMTARLEQTCPAQMVQIDEETKRRLKLHAELYGLFGRRVTHSNVKGFSDGDGLAAYTPTNVEVIASVQAYLTTLSFSIQREKTSHMEKIRELRRLREGQRRVAVEEDTGTTSD